MAKPEKKPQGRPPVILDDVQLRQVHFLSGIGLTTDQIADYFGISTRAFFNAMDRQPEIRATIKEGKAKAIGKVAGKLFENATTGDQRAIEFYLKTQAGWKDQINISGTIAHAHDVTLTKTLDPKVKEALDKLNDIFGQSLNAGPKPRLLDVKPEDRHESGADESSSESS